VYGLSARPQRCPDARGATLHSEDDPQESGGRSGNGRKPHKRQLRLRAAGSPDLLATPNPSHGHAGPGYAVSVALTWVFILSKHPAISIPAGLTKAGAPVGLLLVARPRSEQLLLALAAHAQHPSQRSTP
jgi:hypothetical protein